MPGKWYQAFKESLRSGSAASVLSTCVLLAAGRMQGCGVFAPTNATSQWVWGAPALCADGLSWRHTCTGYGIHHGASIFWALLHARTTADWTPARTSAGAVVGGMAIAAVACLVDFRCTPKRFTPGFEHRLSRGAILAVYLAFGMGIGLASLLHRRRLDRPTSWPRRTGAGPAG